MSRFVFTAVLLALVSPIALANVIIIRVVIDAAPSDPVAPAGTAPASPPETPAVEGSLPPAQESPPRGDPARSVVVMVPVIGKFDDKRVFDLTKSQNPLSNPYWNVIRHKFAVPSGTTFLFTDGTSIFLHPVARPSRDREIRDRFDAWEVKKKSPDELLEISLEALAAEMSTEAEAYCEKLFALAQGKTVSLSPKVQRFAKAYAEIAPKLKAPAPLPSDADRWRDQLTTLAANANVQKYMHYALIYWDVPGEEVTRRLKKLEQNFKNFYLWHALRGEALKVPSKPMVVILAPRSRDVSQLYRALEGRSISTDSFFSAEHDVLVLSPSTMDPVGQAFERMVRPIYDQGKTAAELVKGNGPPIRDQVIPETVARLTTLALVDRVAQDDAESAAISREGSRQILYAIGSFPKYVPLPRWLEHGYGSVYERARLPVYSERETATPRMTFPINRGIGAPHFALLKSYRDLLEAGELDTDPASRLTKVLADEYFTAIASGVDPDARRGPGKGKEIEAKLDPAKARALLKEKLTQKAEATSWSLLYFLVHEKPAELRQFGQELERLPHDFPLDPATLLLAFGRAFKLLKEDGQSLDPTAVKTLGTQWDDFMNTVKQLTFDITIIQVKKPDPKPMTGDPNQPTTGN